MYLFKILERNILTRGSTGPLLLVASVILRGCVQVRQVRVERSRVLEDMHDTGFVVSGQRVTLRKLSSRQGCLEYKCRGE